MHKPLLFSRGYLPVYSFVLQSGRSSGSISSNIVGSSHAVSTIYFLFVVSAPSLDCLFMRLLIQRVQTFAGDIDIRTTRKYYLLVRAEDFGFAGEALKHILTVTAANGHETGTI